MPDPHQKSQNNANDEAEDLMLALMQVPEPPAPSPPSPTRTILDDLRPYPHHEGCGGFVEIQFGLNEEEVPCARFLCHKCQREEVVEGTDIVRDETSGLNSCRIEPPEWTKGPNV